MTLTPCGSTEPGLGRSGAGGGGGVGNSPDFCYVIIVFDGNLLAGIFGMCGRRFEFVMAAGLALATSACGQPDVSDVSMPLVGKLCGQSQEVAEAAFGMPATNCATGWCEFLGDPPQRGNVTLVDDRITAFALTVYRTGPNGEPLGLKRESFQSAEDLLRQAGFDVAALKTAQSASQFSTELGQPVQPGKPVIVSLEGFTSVTLAQGAGSWANELSDITLTAECVP